MRLWNVCRKGSVQACKSWLSVIAEEVEGLHKVDGAGEVAWSSDALNDAGGCPILRATANLSLELDLITWVLRWCV